MLFNREIETMSRWSLRELQNKRLGMTADQGGNAVTTLLDGRYYLSES